MNVARRKIAIVTSGHSPFDDRIFWRFAVTLNEYNYETKIFASTKDLLTNFDGIEIHSFDGGEISKREKLNHFFTLLSDFRPDTIICCEPLTIIVAHKYRKSVKKKVKIISDITEYYPHQNLLKGYTGIKRILYFLKYFLFNVYATNLADELIIGELRKANLYHWIAPLKKKYIIGYYTPKRFFKFSHKELASPITLCYLGEISEQRGIFRFLEVVRKTSINNPEINFNALIIGRLSEKCNLKDLFNFVSDLPNANIIYNDWIDYNKLSVTLSNAHIFIDLREKNIVYNHSLPIKVFDCLAVGRPLIFSNLDSFNEFKDINKFGFLVEPNDIEKVSHILSNYLTNSALFANHSEMANKLYVEKYNWELLEKILLKIVEEGNN